jgi:hypothetical protein
MKPEIEKLCKQSRLEYFKAVLKKEDLDSVHDIALACKQDNVGLEKLSSHLKTYRFFEALCAMGLISDPAEFLIRHIDTLQESFLIDVLEKNKAIKSHLLDSRFGILWYGALIGLSFLQWCVVENKTALVKQLASSLSLDPSFIDLGKQKSSLCLINTKAMLYTLVETHLVSKEEIKIHRNAMIKNNISYSETDKFDSNTLHLIDGIIEMSEREVCQFNPKGMTGSVLEKSISFSCPHLFSFILKTYSENLTQKNIVFALKSALRLGRTDYFEDIIKKCAINPETITSALIDTLEAGEPDFTDIILTNCSIDKNDPALKEAVLHSNNPKAALLFLQKDMPFYDDEILKLIEFAAIKGDSENFNALANYLVKNVGLSHLKIYSKNSPNPIPAEDKAYFSNLYYTEQQPFPQEKFLEAMSHISDILFYALIHDLLDFSDVSNTEIDDTRENLTCAKIGRTRKQLAERSLTSRADSFGVPRASPEDATMITPISATSRYWAFRPPLADESFDKKYVQKGFFIKTGNDRVQEDLFFPQGTTIGYINGKPIELTAYATYYDEVYGDAIAWEHTCKKENIQRAANHIAKLIQDAKKFDLTKHPDKRPELIRHIGRIYWWLAHATLFTRGSASITDAFIKALFKYHGLDARWTGMGDCLALSSPDENEFCDIYAERLSLRLLDITVSSPSPMPKTAASSADAKLALASADGPKLAKHIQFFNAPHPNERFASCLDLQLALCTLEIPQVATPS